MVAAASLITILRPQVLRSLVTLTRRSCVPDSCSGTHRTLKRFSTFSRMSDDANASLKRRVDEEAEAEIMAEESLLKQRRLNAATEPTPTQTSEATDDAASETTEPIDSKGAGTSMDVDSQAPAEKAATNTKKKDRYPDRRNRPKNQDKNDNENKIKGRDRGSRGRRTREESPRELELDADGNPIPKAPKLPKRQCALMMGFCGSGYSGMQMCVGSSILWPCLLGLVRHSGLQKTLSIIFAFQTARPFAHHRRRPLRCSRQNRRRVAGQR